jgi:hypothetical protein
MLPWNHGLSPDLQDAAVWTVLLQAATMRRDRPTEPSNYAERPRFTQYIAFHPQPQQLKRFA